MLKLIYTILIPLFLNTTIFARNFLEKTDFTQDQIKKLKTCACLLDAKGNTTGQVAGLGDVVDNSLVIFDRSVLTKLEKEGSVNRVSIENVLARAIGQSRDAVASIANGMNVVPAIGLPSEEIFDLEFGRLMVNLNFWELHNVVYRPDLGGSDRHGELRLIFKAKETSGVLSRVIFEYKLAKNNFSGTTTQLSETEWAALFAGISCLKNTDFDAYVETLRTLISSVAFSKFEGLPCGSALGQLRINDFSSNRWIMAEFGLKGCGLERRSLPLTPPDNYYQEIDQGVRSDKQLFLLDENFNMALVEYLNGLRTTPVTRQAAMLSDYGDASWMRGILGGISPDCINQCRAVPSTAGCNCFYINHLTKNGINLSDPEVVKRAKKFSLNTCNSCHSGCKTEDGCGGVSFFHTEDDGRAGNFLANDNGEKNFAGQPIGDIANRLDKVVQLLLQPGTGDDPLSRGLCNANIKCNFDYVANGKMDTQDLSHLQSVVSKKISKRAGMTYDLDGDGAINTNDVSLLRSFLEGKLQAGDVFKNPLCDSFMPDFTLTLTLCDRIKLFGDASRDGNITAFDISLMRKFILGIILPDPNLSFDVSGDGKLSTLDIIFVQKYILGLINCDDNGMMLKKSNAGNAKECQVLKSLDTNKNDVLEFKEFSKVSSSVNALGDVDKNGKLTSAEINLLGDGALNCNNFKQIEKKVLLENPDPAIKMKASSSQGSSK